MLKNIWNFRLNKLVPVLKCNKLHLSVRSVSSDESSKNTQNRQNRSLPPLMDFPELVWPTVFKSMRNWILVNFIIRPYIDKEFNMPDFVFGAKQALQAVSTKLSDGDTSGISEWVSKECVNELAKSLRSMSVAQRHEIRVIKEDIYFSFPYQVGIIFDESSSSNDTTQKRWVEITMIFHALRGLHDMQERGETPPINLGVMPEYRDKISICNYRFIKEFTKGNESDWTINIVNHFKPNDLLEE
ncbi:m-AAA protease-interacting protein 1, mitochondrial [Phlebotomus papatasi]|uniref:Uncharacterized protein n=1 Tax=Phlebotomus papatasi TaxID=29031 RepID=A0A1B0GQQ7_PHLPP|nr:m-AAA protease-interacting protein 1, mitochondrial [Phlebotomus papatasi]